MRKLMLFIALSGLFISGYAQKNVVKLNVTALGFKNIEMDYQRVLSDKISINLGANYISATTMPGASSIDLSGFTTPEFGGWGVTGEFRFHFNKEKANPRGFYFAPYLRYKSYSVTSESIIPETPYIVNANGTDYTVKMLETAIPTEIQLNIFMGGIMLGHQWLVNDKFAIDFGWMGFGIGSASMSGIITLPSTIKIEVPAGVPAGVKDQVADMDKALKELGDEFEKELKNVSVGGMTSSRDGNEFTITSPSFVMPSGRFFIKLGYAF